MDNNGCGVCGFETPAHVLGCPAALQAAFEAYCAALAAKNAITLIGPVPPGTVLVAVRNRVLAVAPGMAPCFVTPTGLEPLSF